MKPVRILLTVLPFIWTIGLIPFANRVEPKILGLPFLAFWMSLGIYVTFACIFLLNRIDDHARDDREGAGDE